jgi:hypothetical protein
MASKKTTLKKDQSALVFDSDCTMFLCLPEHKDGNEPISDGEVMAATIAFLCYPDSPYNKKFVKLLEKQKKFIDRVINEMSTTEKI